MARKDNVVDDMNDPGSKMRQARQQRNITLTQMADLTGLSKGYLSHIENGRAKPTFDILQKYERILSLASQSLTETVTSEMKIVDQNPSKATGTKTVIDWGEMPPAKPGLFCGRDQEMRILTETLRDSRKQVITIVGLGGVGKTTLAREAAEHLAHDDVFQFIFWISLRSTRTINDIYNQIRHFFHATHAQEQDTVDQHSQFFRILQRFRCLIILDNAESLLDEESQATHLMTWQKEFLSFIQTFANESDEAGQPIISKLLLTGRRDITEYLYAVQSTSPATAYRHATQTTRFATVSLTGIKSIEEGRKLVESWNLEQAVPWHGTEASWHYLITYYGGIPLALLLVAPTIALDFHGNVDHFVDDYLKTGGAVLGGMRDILKWHFDSLNLLERQVMFWLAIEQEAISLDVLMQDLVSPPPRDELQATLTSLRRHLLVESPMTIDPAEDPEVMKRNQKRGQYLLQPVIYEYMITQLVEQAFDVLYHALTVPDTPSEHPAFTVLAQHALFKAQAEDFVHQQQRDFILRPLATRLLAAMPHEELRDRLCVLLDALRAADTPEPTYIAGNIFNLVVFIAQYLPAYQLKVMDFDFSRLVLRQVYLRANGQELQHVRLADVTLIEPVFIETIAPIESVAYHPDERLFAAGMTTGAIRTWRAVAGTSHTTTYEGHTDWVRTVAFSPDGTLLASGSEDKTVRLWQVGTGQCLATLTDHADWIWAVTFSSDGRWLASASEDGTVRIWDVHRQTPAATLHGTAPLRSVAFAKGGGMIAAGSSMGSVTLWKYTIQQGRNGQDDFHTSDEVALSAAHQGKVVWSVAFSPDGAILATAGADRAIRLWDTTDGHWLESFWGHINSVWSAVFRDADTIISSSADRTIRFWRRGEAEEQDSQEGYDNRITSATFAPDANYLATGSVDRTLRLWDVLAKRSVWSIQGYTSWVWSVSFHPHGNILASSNENQTIRIWYLDHNSPNDCLELPRDHSNAVWVATFSPDGEQIASGSEDKTVRLWDVTTRTCLQVLQGHTSWISAISYSPDGRLLASSSGDHTIRLWDAASGDCLRVLTGHKNAVWSVAFSPDSQKLVSGGADNRVVLWDVGDLTDDKDPQIAMYMDHSDWVWSVAFSPDGRYIASGGADKRIVLRHVGHARTVTILTGHADRVRSLAFRHDSKVLASGGSDKTVRLWGVEEGSLLQTLRKHTARVRSVSFNLAGDILASGGEDGVIHLWHQIGDRDEYSHADQRSNSENRPYDGMNITHVHNLTPRQIISLQELGAIVEGE